MIRDASTKGNPRIHGFFITLSEYFSSPGWQSVTSQSILALDIRAILGENAAKLLKIKT